MDLESLKNLNVSRGRCGNALILLFIINLTALIKSHQILNQICSLECCSVLYNRCRRNSEIKTYELVCVGKRFSFFVAWLHFRYEQEQRTGKHADMELAACSVVIVWTKVFHDTLTLVYGRRYLAEDTCRLRFRYRHILMELCRIIIYSIMLFVNI